jgi:hypothetical protein
METIHNAARNLLSEREVETLKLGQRIVYGNRCCEVEEFAYGWIRLSDCQGESHWLLETDPAIVTCREVIQLLCALVNDRTCAMELAFIGETG